MNDNNGHEWSKYQQAFFANFEEDEGHAVGEAVPGSGKTTTAIASLDYVPDGHAVQLCAFSKSIERELKRRVPRRVDVATLNSLGFKAIRNAFGDVEFDEDKTKDLAKSTCIDDGHCFTNRKGDVIALGWSQVNKLAQIAKCTLTPEDDLAALENLATEYHLDDNPKAIRRDKLASFASETLRRCAEMKSVIDYSDQGWFPARFELRPATHDLVVVDEAQDLDAAQQYLIQALCKRDGRIVAIGDRRQAIFGFRGADSNSMPNLIRHLDATILPLSITYRCPTRVVELAQEIGPEIQARPGAPEGIVDSVESEDLVDLAKPGDMIVSRTKAPLLGHCFRLLAAGVPAAIAGRDFGYALIRLMERAKTDDVPAMNRWIQAWKAKEVARLTEIDREDKVAEVVDQAAAVYVLSDGQRSVEEVKRKLISLCSDKDPRAQVLLSTTHKAKGLERDRVFVLADTYKLKSFFRPEEERNLWYVAVTRAKAELYLVGEVRR